MFRIIVAGTRDFNNFEMLNEILEGYIDKMNKDSITIVSGCARGADKFGEVFAENHSLNLVKFPANWDKYGKDAGFIRNTEMGDYASEDGYHGVLFAFWNGISNGTKDMITKAINHGMEIHIIVYTTNDDNEQEIAFETDTLDNDYFKTMPDEPEEEFMNEPVDDDASESDE